MEGERIAERGREGDHMRALLLIGAADPDNAAWARWLRDVMESWPMQLAILLLYVGLAVLLVRHASREWDKGARNPYLVGFLVASGAFFVLQFLLGSSLLDVVAWPTVLYVIEFVVLFALWLYAFVRFMTRQRSGPGDDEARRRGADLERVIGPPGGQP
jgi:membrane protein implicated in regulation of membrane protease activity